MSTTSEQPRMIGVKEVAERYGIPISTQREYRNRGTFAPFIRVGRRVLYRPEAIEQWIRDQETKIREGGE